MDLNASSRAIFIDSGLIYGFEDAFHCGRVLLVYYSYTDHTHNLYFSCISTECSMVLIGQCTSHCIFSH